MNGFIQYKTNSATSGVSRGDSVPVSSSWSSDIQCTYVANTQSNKGRYIGGAFTVSSFTVLIDQDSFNAKMIRLKDSRGVLICESAIQSIEILEEVQKVKITI